MKLNDMVAAGFDGVLKTLERVLDGLTEEDLNWQPRPDCNSIGWLTWHIARGQDSFIATLLGKEQLWIKDGWHAKFGRPPDAQDNGAGHTPQDLAAFKSPDAKTLLDYQRAVTEQAQRYFPTLSEADWDRVIEVPWMQPPPPLGAFLMLILGDGLQHAGQAAYIRGLRQGKGWQPF